MMKVLKVQLGEEVRFQPLCRRRSTFLAAPDIDALALKRRESGSGCMIRDEMDPHKDMAIMR
jgi:hypothetical protein